MIRATRTSFHDCPVSLAAILFLAVVGVPLAPAATVNVLDHGAVGDATTLCTEALQKAIDVCAETGGTVVVPAGIYRMGCLQLKSNVTLQLEAGAILRASEERSDHRGRALIAAQNVENIGIIGRGTIDDRGTAYVYLDRPRTNPGDFDPKFTRQGGDFMSTRFGTEDGPVTFGRRLPRLIRFDSCKNVLLSGVTLKDASIWTIHLENCELVHITGLKVLNNPLIPNNDGIHITTCRNVHISDCELFCGDDAICITSVESRSRGFCENVTVSNCTMSSRSAGVRVGYGPNTIRNCVFENLVIRNSNRGIGLFVRQQGSIENIMFNNIVIETRLHTGQWWGKAEPIHLSVQAERTADTQQGRIRNIVFSNILADSEAGVVMWAKEPGQIEEVTLDRVRLRVRKGPLSNSYGGNLDLRPASERQLAIFKHDLAAIFCHQADGVTLSNVDVRWGAETPPFYTHALWFEQSNDVLIDGFRGRQPSEGEGRAAILLDTVRGVTIRDCQAAEGTTTFVRHRGVTDAGLFGNNDVARAAQVFDPQPSPFGH